MDINHFSSKDSSGKVVSFGDCKVVDSTILVDGYDYGYGDYARLVTPSGKVRLGRSTLRYFTEGDLMPIATKSIQKSLSYQMTRLKSNLEMIDATAGKKTITFERMRGNVIRKMAMVEHALTQIIA